MRWLRTVGATAALLLLTACGEDIVIDAPAAAEPYAGSLARPSPIKDDPDVFARGGAAALALECEGKVVNGGSPDIVTLGADPTEAVENWVDGDAESFGGLPSHGYRIEREDENRVLFSVDVFGASKVTVIVSDDGVDESGAKGWAVESWANCDPAELPAAITEEMDIPIWTGVDGARVFTYLVTSNQGSEHCDWDDITFLDLGAPQERTFVRDTEGEFDLEEEFSDSITLPSDAIDTTWEHDGRHLWLAADDSVAYLVSVDDSDDVERWPRATGVIGCG